MAISAAITSVVVFVASALGAGYVLRPDGDVSSQWNVVGAPAAWEALDDTITQPTSAGSSDYISSGASNRVTEVSLGNQALSGQSITSGKAWVYAGAGMLSSAKVEVVWGGAVRGSLTVNGGLLGSSPSWRSISVTPPSQGALDDLRLRFTSTGGGDVTVRAAYFEIGTQTVSGCPLTVPDAALTMTLSGCNTIASDTASGADPLPFWGEVACQESSRQTRPSSGGDGRAQANGTSQGNSSYRRITVLDGDDFYGERCELGENDHRAGPTVFYRDGQRRATYVSIRLPSSFPLGVYAWQNVLQMKQTQPADNGGGTPVLSLKAFDGRWILFHSSAGKTEVDDEVWSTPAQAGVWTRFAFDVTYSQGSGSGRIKVYADLNADGDFSDSGEQSPRLQLNTLKTETSGSSDDGFNTGQALPSHLRMGIYHDSEIDCPAPSGCSVELDNLQVLGP